jgi:hypothetical protein
MLVWGVAIPREHLQTAAISGLESDGNSGSHTPVISVDTKKKELIGNYKNGGTDYRASPRCDCWLIFASPIFCSIIIMAI